MKFFYFILILSYLLSSCYNRTSPKRPSLRSEQSTSQEFSTTKNNTGEAIPPLPPDESHNSVMHQNHNNNRRLCPFCDSRDSLNSTMKAPKTGNSSTSKVSVVNKRDRTKVNSGKPVKEFTQTKNRVEKKKTLPLTMKRKTNKSATILTNKPGIRFVTKIKDFDFTDIPVHHSNYVANNGIRYVAVKPKVFNVKTHQIIHLDQLKRQLSGWYMKSLVYYDAKKGVAGILLRKRKLSISRKNFPKCPCGGKSIYLAYMKKYYCPNCKLFLPNSKKMPTTSYEQYYGHFSLKTSRLLWRVKISDSWTGTVGVDEKGESLMFHKAISGWNKDGSPKSTQVFLYRVSLIKRKVDWKYSFKMPMRNRKQSLFHNISYYGSRDLKKIFIWEYDEKDSRHPRGYLKNPSVRGYIVDVENKKHIVFTAPLTSYGYLFSKDNSFLYLGSYQLGKIYKIDSKTGKTVKKVYARKGTFKLIMSKSEKFLYSFNKTGVKVFDVATMKLVKTIPLSKLFPKIKKLLSVEKILPLTSGKFLIKKIKPTRVSGYGSTSGSKETLLFSLQE